MESSRFGSSGNLSQTSSQLSETGQESTGGSELEESFHSYHSTGFHPSTNGGQPRTNGHTNGHPGVNEQEVLRSSPELESSLKNKTPPEKTSTKLLRYSRSNKHFNCLHHSYLLTLTFMTPRFRDEGPPLPFSASRVRWLKAINKVRVQLREVGPMTFPLVLNWSVFLSLKKGWVKPLWLF